MSKVKASKKTAKRPKRERAPVRELVLADLAAEELTVAQIAAKHKINVKTVNGYKTANQRLITEAKVRGAWPADSNGQVKEALSRLCFLTSVCSPASAKELAGAVDVVGRLNLVYDGRASVITETNAKNANLDLSQFTTEELKQLVNLEALAAGRRHVEPPSASALDCPVIYSDTDPSCTSPVPLQDEEKP